MVKRLINLCLLLFLSAIIIKAETIIVSISGSSGSFGIQGEAYVDYMDTEFQIDVGPNQRVKLDFTINVESCCDLIKVYETNDNFTTKELGTMVSDYESYTYTSYGKNGKLIVKFTSDTNTSYDKGYNGFTVAYSTTTEALNTLPLNGESNLGIDVPSILNLKSDILRTSSNYTYFNSKKGFVFGTEEKPGGVIIAKSGNVSLNGSIYTNAVINGQINGNKWEQLFVFNHNEFAGKYSITFGNGGNDIGKGWFPCVSGFTIDNAPAFYINADHGGESRNGRGILVLDGRIKGGAAGLNDVVVEFTSGYGRRLGYVRGDGSIIAMNQVVAKEVKVEAQPADFVFEENYELKELSEVENFIKTNNHLPDIPSASEMEKSGINLAEMNKLLLQKIEELTLYTIQQEMKLKEKDKKIESMESRLDKIESLLK